MEKKIERERDFMQRLYLLCFLPFLSTLPSCLPLSVWISRFDYYHLSLSLILCTIMFLCVCLSLTLSLSLWLSISLALSLALSLGLSLSLSLLLFPHISASVSISICVSLPIYLSLLLSSLLLSPFIFFRSVRVLFFVKNLRPPHFSSHVSGTENVALIAGMGAASILARREADDLLMHMLTLKLRLILRIRDKLADLKVGHL